MFEKIIEESQKHRVYIITSEPAGGDMFLRTYGALRGCCNVSFISPEGLAEQIAEKQIIESYLEIASSETISMMLLGIIKDYGSEESVFSRIKDTMGFYKAAGGFVEVMRRAGLTPAELKGLSDAFPAFKRKWRELSDIYKRYLAELKDRNRLDNGDVLAMAVKELSSGECARLKSSKLYLMDDVYDFKLYRKMFEALRRNYGMEEISSVLVPSAGSGALGRLQKGIFSKASGRGKVDETARLLVLHDARKEAREIIRSIVFEAEGGFGESSLAVANYGENVKYISEMLDMAGIPAVFTGGLPVFTTRTGAAVLRFIRFLKEDREYLPFIKLLEEAPFDKEAVFGGAGKFLSRAKLRGVFQKVAPAGGPDEWLKMLEKKIKANEYDEAPAGQLVKLLEKFRRDFSVIYRKRKGAGEIAFKDILSALKKFPGGWLTAHSAQEAAALQNIRRTVNELEKSAGFLSIGADRGLTIIEEKIGSLMTGARQPDGKSLVVTPLRSAGWIYSKQKYFYGLDENSIPRKTARIPFLPEEERLFLNSKYKCGIYGREEVVSRDRNIFRSAINTVSGRVVFAYADINAEDGKTMLPSPFIQEAFEAVTGLSATTENIISAWAEDRLCEADKQISRAGYEKNITESGKVTAERLMPLYPDLASGYETLRMRLDSSAFSDRDGLITDRELAKKCGISENGGIVSNKKAEMYSVCPFQYFVKYILRAEPAEIIEIDRSRWPDPMTRGNVYHGIYCSFLSELKKKGKLPLTDSEANFRLLNDIADKTVTELKEEYEPPNSYMEGAFRAEVGDNLKKWYDFELKDQLRWKPVYFELPLGKPRVQSEGIPGEGFKAFFEARGKKYEVSGWIDRIDTDEKGNIRITDYKTGKAEIKTGDILKDGKNLQLVFYAKALESILKKLALSKRGKIYVRYYYSTSTGGFKGDEVEVTPKLTGKFDRIMDIMSRASARGVFIPQPDEESCEHCDYTRICGDMAGYIYGRKITSCGDGAVKDFLQIRKKGAAE